MRLLIIGLLLLQISCSVLSKRGSLDYNNPQIKEKEAMAFSKAENFQNQNNFLMAFNAWNDFKTKFYSSPKVAMAEFNAAYCLEQMGVYDQAAESYRGLLSLWAKLPENYTRTQYRLSIVYERLGQDPKAIALMLEILKTNKYLRSEILDLELPARLANAYARLGNEERSLFYYDKATLSLKNIKKSENTAADDLNWMGELLYQVGRIALNKTDERTYAVDMKALEMGQVYLIRTMELDIESWSELAYNDLVAKYQSVLQELQAASRDYPEDIEQAIEAQKVVIANAEDLRKRSDLARFSFNPTKLDHGKSLKSFYQYLDKLDKDLEVIILQRPIGPGLTD